MFLRMGRALPLALILGVVSPAMAADESAVVRSSTTLLEEISSNPKSGIPLRFLQEAEGIVIVPHIVENQLVLGRKRGHGVFLTRDEKGRWGNPEPVEIRGGSGGAEAGRMVTDLVMIYRTRRAVNGYDMRRLTLSAGFQFVGERNRTHTFRGPGADIQTKADVITYIRYRGFLLGVSIIGEARSMPNRPRDVPTPLSKPDSSTDVAKVAANPTKPEAPTAKAKLMRDSPDVDRLKSILTAMTNHPSANVAGTSVKDTKVTTAGGVTTSSRGPGRAPAKQGAH